MNKSECRNYLYESININVKKIKIFKTKKSGSHGSRFLKIYHSYIRK